jgi:hypothetical protein
LICFTRILQRFQTVERLIRRPADVTPFTNNNGMSARCCRSARAPCQPAKFL